MPYPTPLIGPSGGLISRSGMAVIGVVGSAPVPLTIQDLGAQVYYDMTDQATGMIMATGNNVLTVLDKSGNDRHITQANAAKQGVWNTTQSALATELGTQLGTLSEITYDSLLVVLTWINGTESTFNTYNVITSESGNANRIIGGAGSSNLFSTVVTNQAYINGSTSSTATVLPAAKKMMRFSFASITDTVDILHFSGSTATGWRGLAYTFIIPPIGADSTWFQKAEGILAHEKGIILADGHPYKDSPPVAEASAATPLFLNTESIYLNNSAITLNMLEAA